jgi:hypothetical protein
MQSHAYDVGRTESSCPLYLPCNPHLLFRIASPMWAETSLATLARKEPDTQYVRLKLVFTAARAKP